MTLTLDRLRALKRQAGATDAPIEVASARPSAVRDSSPPAVATPGAAHPSAPAPWVAVRERHASAGASDDAPPRSASSTHANAHASERIASTQSLRRLLGLRERAPVAAPRRSAERALPGREIGEGLWLIESQVADPPPGAPVPLAFARREDHLDTSNVLFFDTETTGLAGGTGTRAFMIGAADWHEGALRIRQLLIANMAAEKAMLREFASWLSPSTVLASYNGRSYDAPLLRTRYRLARLPDALHGIDHVDLLHPSRRRWRGRWENCRLATIEREALRILREDDLPGSQAPAAWLSYLRGGASTNLRRVAEHNRQDVATLAQLLLRLADDRAE